MASLAAPALASVFDPLRLYAQESSKSDSLIITKVEPQYPEVARKARISGIVIVECTISKNGDVTDVHVLKPLPFGLDQAAVDAVRRWKFRPGTLNGQPVDVLFNLTVNFKLN